MTTDAQLWSAAADYELSFARIRGRNLFVSAANGAPPVFVYDLAGTTGCSGTPVVCTPVRDPRSRRRLPVLRVDHR